MKQQGNVVQRWSRHSNSRILAASDSGAGAVSKPRGSTRPGTEIALRRKIKFGETEAPRARLASV